MNVVVTLGMVLLVCERGCDMRCDSVCCVNVVVTLGMVLLVCERGCDIRGGSVCL